ncbi:hypothetical protein TRFO_39029 [Tritrichomonas foetus]|uniref:Uncharacterized protein n=1 Tax=Tritrichomonas foetus TaxID=1144522 RepID=A0A1J4J6D4_9EUKA|nr:hypothetical protein TRFO_39029 [Tritrichomonas foetus]|eukprot:OHS94790.1 hypothetical protein TRFO_39029 [Tritrichomonas foetus]
MSFSLSTSGKERENLNKSDDIAQIRILYQNSLNEIENLKNERSSLQTQYDEAMTYVSQIDNLHKTVSDLTKENLKLNSEKDELNRRLQISLQVSEEAKSRIQLQKDSFSNKNDVRSIFEQEKNKLNNQIDQLNKKLLEKDNELNESEKEKEEMNEDINNLLTTAKNKFLIAFNSIQSLTNFLMKNQNSENSTFNSFSQNTQLTNNNSSFGLNNSFSSSMNVEDRFDVKYEIMLDKIQHYKHLLNNEKNQRKETEEKLLHLEKQKEIQANEANKIISDLETQINETQKKMEEIENRYNQEISLKNNEIESLQRQLSNFQNLNQLKTTKTIKNKYENKLSKLTQQIEDLKEKLNFQAIKIKESTVAFTTQNKKISILTNQLQKYETTVILEKQRMIDTERRNNQLQEEVQSLKAELNEQKIENDQLEMQISFNNSRNKTGKTESEMNQSKINELMQLIEDSKAGNQVVQALIENQKKELSSIYKERETIFQIIQKQNILLKYYDNQTTKLEKEKNELLHQIRLLNESKCMQKTVEPIDSNIPLTAWTCSDFPKELVKAMLETAKLESLSNSSKIEKVLKIIAIFYATKLDKKDSEIKSMKIECKDNNKLLNKFIDIITDSLHENRLDLKHLKSNPLIFNDFGERIQIIQDENKNLRHDKTQVEENLLQLYMKLNSNNLTEALSEIKNSNIKIHTLASKLQKEKNKSKKLIQIIKICKKKFNQKSKKLENKNLMILKKINELEDSNKKLQSENKILSDANMKYEVDFNNFKEVSQKDFDAVTKETNQRIEKIKKQFLAEKNELVSQLTMKQDSIKELTDFCESTQKENDQMKQDLVFLKKAKDSRDQQLHILANQFKEMQQQCSEEITKCKNSCNSQIEQIMITWRDKNDTLRNLLDKATEALSNSDEQNKYLVEENKEISNEKQQLLGKIESLKREIMREKQLSETKLKSEQMSTNMKIQSITEELKSNFDKQKRELYSDISNSFKFYFDASQQIDERSFKDMLNKVSFDLTRLIQQENKIRSMLGITHNDSLESAISHLFLSQYHD